MDSGLAMRTLRAMTRLGHSGHALPELFQQATRLLREVVPYEAGCWHTLDPTTLLETSHDVVNLPFENPRASELEYLHQDFNHFAALARGPRCTGILSEATGGKLERCIRYRELIQPFGLKNELRVSFVTQGSGWGAACLLREPGSPDFNREEAALLEKASAPLANAVRTAVLRDAASGRDAGLESPGLIVLDRRLRIEAITPAARRLLGEIKLSQAPNGAPDQLPYVVYAVASRARLAGRSSFAQDMAVARVSTGGSGWLVLYGSLVEDDPDRAAVVVDRAHPPSLSPVIARAYGLTAREQDVLLRALRGQSTKAMARLLNISPNTVQEHFKKIFDKLDVRSRRELVGKIFYGHYGRQVNS